MPETEFLNAQQVMEQVADLKLGDPTPLEHQHLLNPSFIFGGPQQKGSENRLAGKKILIYGAGDVWYKFIQGPLKHLGIRPEDITLVDLADPPIPKGLEWQYKDVNVVTRKDFQAKIDADKDYIKKQGFNFSIVATPPSAHAICAEEAINNGLPVFIEKPMFKSTKEYDAFANFCKEKGGHVYAIDWQRALSTVLYSALGQKVPFADAISYRNESDKEVFKALAGEELDKVSARFVEGRGNALAAIDHRGHLATATLGEETGWGSAGMNADMGIHPNMSLTGGGLTLDAITDAFFGGPSDENGYREVIPQNRKGTHPEMYSRVQSKMTWKGKSVPVEIECGKGPAPNVNDGRTIFKFKSGKTLVHEFGHLTNNVTLYDTDGKTILAQASDRGEPYGRMFMEGDDLFKKWAAADKAAGEKQARIAYGPESREAIKLVEEAHRHACDNPSPPDRKMRQLALDEMGVQPDVGEKSKDFKIHDLGDEERGKKYKIISPEEVIKGSCQRHSTAENAIFDRKSGCFYYVDIEHGLLTRYNPGNGRSKTWKLTSDSPDVDGRPKQMLSVVKINQEDGSIMVLLSGDGDGPGKRNNAGWNYFNPDTEKLTSIGKIPNEEKQHPDNRFNDEATLNINGKNWICYGTMNKHWDKLYHKGEYQRTGAFYLVDPKDLASHKLTFDNTYKDPASSTGVSKLLPPIITNGLAGGGDAGNGKRYLFWSETVEDPGKGGAQLNVYRGTLDPKNYKVSGIELFKNHKELGGMMNGVETFGRPDGAKKGIYNGRDVYGISMLELGEIRFYYSGQKDGEYGKEALRIKLPKGMSRNTQFALGEDKDGKPIAIVTTQDPGHFSRRWNAVKPGEAPNKAKDGLNGTVICFDLPEGLRAHPQSVARVDYPSLEKARKLADNSVPSKDGLHKQVHIERIREYGHDRIQSQAI